MNIIKKIKTINLILITAFTLSACSPQKNTTNDPGTDPSIPQNQNKAQINKQDHLNENQNKQNTSTDNLKCENIYQEILDENREDFSTCYGIIEGPDCGSLSTKNLPQNTNLILIFDASGSMAARIEGQTRMEIAKEATKNFVKSLNKDTNVALMVYGHKGSNQYKDKKTSCEGIDIISPLGPLDIENIFNTIDALSPTGYTPISASLNSVKNILTDYPGEKHKNIVLLISDGEETCDGDPVQTAKELNEENIETITNVIGFDVGGNAEKQLKSIAQAGGGTYYSARSLNELNAALANLAKLECTYDENSKLLDAYLSTELNMMDCQNSLIFEKNAVVLDIDLMDTEECQNYAQIKYLERFNSVKDQLGDIYNKGITQSKNIFGDQSEIGKFKMFFNTKYNSYKDLQNY